MAESLASPKVEQFDTSEQREHTAEVGMWVFLATEVLFFGGLFTAYCAYRHTLPAVFASGVHEMNLLLGSINTGVLLTSSLTMAMAVDSSREGRRGAAAAYLAATTALGLLFIGIKAAEYSEHIGKHSVPASSMFFFLYYAMTGLHALHLSIACGITAWLGVRAWRGAFGPAYNTPVEVGGLYWHFVDIVWVFLFPMFYLLERAR